MGETARPTPAVSVVMPVHNTLAYLDASIRSILSQSFDDFEFVILDDASTDGTTERLSDWSKLDRRIRLFRSPQKLGLSVGSNAVVRAARAPLVARMDADDVSHPERLARQVEVMRRLPDVALVGALCDGIDASGRRVRPRDRWRLVRRSPFPPFPHGSVMFRRAAFEDVGGYNEEYASAEDQELFLRLARARRVVVLPDLLYHYRYHDGCSTIYHLTAKAQGNGEERQYEEHKAPSPEDPRDASLRALRYAASMRLWAGHRPELLQVLLSNGALAWRPQAAYTLAWAAWARASPGSLRASLRAFIRARDLLVGGRHRDGRVYEWRFE